MTATRTRRAAALQHQHDLAGQAGGWAAWRGAAGSGGGHGGVSFECFCVCGHESNRAARPFRPAASFHIIFSIVIGFLSLTMSPMVRSTAWVPVFFHQCLVPMNSRATSPALCRMGTAHLLLYS